MGAQHMSCLASRGKSFCRCSTFEHRSHCNETFVMYKCFQCRRESCAFVQCVNVNYVLVKLYETQIEISWSQISKTCKQLLKVSDQNSFMVDLINLNDLRKQLANKKSVGCCI